MSTLIFKSKNEALNSKAYKTNDFSRFYENTISNEFVIETENFGTCLSHHVLISTGKNI